MRHNKTLRALSLTVALIAVFSTPTFNITWAAQSGSVGIGAINDHYGPKPVGDVAPPDVKVLPEDRAPRLRTYKKAKMRRPVLRSSAGLSVIPGGSSYGYNWLNSQTDGLLLTSIYDALLDYANSVYASDESFTAVNGYASAGYSDFSDFGLKLDLNASNQLVSGTNTNRSYSLIGRAWAAFAYDNPQFYMLENGYGLTFSYSAGTYIATVTNFTPHISLDYKDLPDRTRAEAVIEAKYNEYANLVSSVSTDYDKIRLVHDKMLAERDYSFVPDGVGGFMFDENPYAHNILGVMDLSTHGPVCESYAKAFSYILNRLGLQSIMIVGVAGSGGSGGGGHAWNMVNIGGSYYYVDPTWDDLETVGYIGAPNNDEGNLTNSLYYKYFMAGSSNTGFTGTHTPGTPGGLNGFYLYDIPQPISTSNYDTITGSSYKWLTDNGLKNSLYNYPPDYTYYVGYTNDTGYNSHDPNALLTTPNNEDWYWNGDKNHDFGSYTISSSATDMYIDGKMWLWDFNKYATIENLFTNPVRLTQDQSYYVAVEKPYHAGINRAYVYGTDGYRGIDFARVNLTFANASAAVTNLTVSGKVGTALTSGLSTTIKLTNASVVRGGLSNANVTSWFTNMPAGITATANAASLSDTITVAFSGTPTDGLTSPFSISIPASAQTSGVNLTVTVNANAKFEVETFISVTEITSVPTEATVGSYLALTGFVSPANAENQTITWRVKDAGGTGAAIIGGTAFSATNAGTAVVTATVANGTAIGTDYTQDFDITVTELTPTISEVIVYPSTVDVQTGTSQQFNAAVIGTNNPPQTVEWNVSGNQEIGTSIDQFGLLSIDINEPLSTSLSGSALTVTATSTSDNLINGASTVYVTDQYIAPEVTNVTVLPDSATVHKGGAQRFTALVDTQGGASTDVNWSITGENNANTTISNGLLTIDINETAQTLTVTATSVEDSNKFGSADITLINPPMPPTVTTQSLSNGTIGTAYTQTLSAVGSAGITWSLQSGSLPDGLNIDSNGTISGTPSTSGTFNFTVKASNGILPDATKALSITIGSPALYKLTVNDSYAIQNGAGNYAADSIVTINAGSRSSYNFYRWTSPDVTFTNASNATTTFKMPAKNVTVTASWNYNYGSPSGGGYSGSPNYGGSNNNNTNTNTNANTGSNIMSGISPAMAELLANGSTTDIGENKVRTPAGQEPVKNPEGSSTLPGGGLLSTTGGTNIEVPSGTTISEDGMTITIPPGSKGANIQYSDGSSVYVGPGMTIVITGSGVSGSDVRIFWNNPFSDIHENDWFYDAVKYVQTHNLFSGTATNSYSPNMNMSRAMLATVLGRYMEIDTTKYPNSVFEDVNDKQPYLPYIEWARQAGIVSGVGNNKYNPDTPITRQDLIVILNRFAGIANKKLPVTREYTGFNDESKFADYAKDSIQVFFKAGVINGKGNGVFDPTATATRAEVAIILQKFLEMQEQ